MSRERRGGEGCITGGGDAGFHAEILGDDPPLPPHLLAAVREQVRRAGLDPAGVRR